jgi:predicted RNase H-like HicB family nuclease
MRSHYSYRALSNNQYNDQAQEGLAMTEIVFLVEDDPDGGYTARALGESIFTQADDIESLREMVRDAVHCHFPDEQNRPKVIRLHIVRDEVFAS